MQLLQNLPQPIPPPQMPDQMHIERRIMDDEPASKKARADGDNELMQEQEFLATHPSPVNFKVQVPDMREKTEWRCHGQTLMLTLPLTDQVYSSLFLDFFSFSFYPCYPLVFLGPIVSNYGL